MLFSTLLSAIFSSVNDTTSSCSNDTSKTFLDDLDPFSSDESLINWGLVIDDDNDNEF